MRWTLLLAGAGAALGAVAGGTDGAAGNDGAADTLWGTYRPQLYFGMRPRLPQSLLTGLAWYSTQDYRGVEQMRHSCADNGGIDSFGWTYHDGKTFGEQEIVDRSSNYRITTSFIKTATDHPSGGNWAVRVSGTVLDESKPAKIATIFYAGAEADDVHVAVADGRIQGSAPVLGEFSLHTEDAPGSQKTDVIVGSSIVAHDKVWQARDALLHDMAQRVQDLKAQGAFEKSMPTPEESMRLSGNTPAGSTFAAFQRNVEGNFSFDVFYEAHSTPGGSRLSGAALGPALEGHKAEYERRFESTFGLHQREYSEKQAQDARELTAQIVGGIGYYYGTSLVDRRYTSEHDDVLHGAQEPSPEYAPARGLLTATPSRSVFPRGFYWDEGFHLAHIIAWDPKLGIEILRSWTALIDEDGWVAREQILGEEARAQVPEAFQTQYPQYGNPPALIMGLVSLFDIASRSDMASTGTFNAELRAFLDETYESWRRHYQWYRRTQRGEVREWRRRATSRNEAYRWRGRTQTHVLTSGLDDYPRAPEPHSGELHVDLHSWMGYFARAMKTFANMLGHEDDEDEYARHERAITANVVDLHWSASDKLFCDASVNHEGDSYHVCHAGYVSLYPLLMQLLDPQSEQLGEVIKLLRDDKHLWSSYGLRSLSKSHELYGTEEDYWRGAIWMPINYLALSALSHYGAVHGPHQAAAVSAYKELRSRVVKTVLDEYHRSGYTWEQYDPETGRGRRGHPFTGWTSLVVLIMAEQY
ncbi:mannosyl-oligosaccharide glucosidase [Malassezia cuniculi]|uniref:Mannosyl-oligosaccharide glucosidase n=1 Tax=Malassezia cuniculi TaxID=948313 RepID=A0AAF0J6J7_9BASI|nr:mannosyl-oligosaccharide glucosidase [Malassezia cuniculi]